MWFPLARTFPCCSSSSGTGLAWLPPRSRMPAWARLPQGSSAACQALSALKGCKTRRPQRGLQAHVASLFLRQLSGLGTGTFPFGKGGCISALAYGCKLLCPEPCPFCSRRLVAQSGTRAEMRRPSCFLWLREPGGFPCIGWLGFTYHLPRSATMGKLWAETVGESGGSSQGTGSAVEEGC